MKSNQGGEKQQEGGQARAAYVDAFRGAHRQLKGCCPDGVDQKAWEDFLSKMEEAWASFFAMMFPRVPPSGGE